MNIIRIILILMIIICFISNTIWADDENKTDPGKLQETLEKAETETEMPTEKAVFPEVAVLKSGTIIDDKTLIKLQESMRYSELANLQLATVELAIKKASSDYFNTFKIWLALNGVKQGEFDSWDIKGNKAVLKKEKGKTNEND